MAKTVTYFTRRRVWSLLATAIVGAALMAILLARSRSPGNPAHLSGWLLLSSLVFLAVYNLRKKLTYPPLLRSSTWLQLHVYVGLLSVLLFTVHIGFGIPRGPLEQTLALLYVGVATSGLVGLFLSRVIPRRLSVRGEEVLFERIPTFRRRLAERVEQLVIRSAEESQAVTLTDFHQQRLAGFFAGNRNFFHHLMQSAAPLHELQHELHALDRYFNEAEQSIASELAELIEAKDGLDYHHAMQSILKGWLFVHIPLTYPLLLFSLVHALLATAFSGPVS